MPRTPPKSLHPRPGRATFFPVTGKRFPVSSFPNYEKLIADRKYAEIAAAIGAAGKTVAASVRDLIDRVRALIAAVGVPLTIRELGVDRDAFVAKPIELDAVAA